MADVAHLDALASSLDKMLADIGRAVTAMRDSVSPARFDERLLSHGRERIALGFASLQLAVRQARDEAVAADVRSKVLGLA